MLADPVPQGPTPLGRHKRQSSPRETGGLASPVTGLEMKFLLRNMAETQLQPGWALATPPQPRGSPHPPREAAETQTPQPGKGLTTPENFRTCHGNKAPRSVFKNKQTESSNVGKGQYVDQAGFIPGMQGWLIVRRADGITHHVYERNPHNGGGQVCAEHRNHPPQNTAHHGEKCLTGTKSLHLPVRMGQRTPAPFCLKTNKNHTTTVAASRQAKKRGNDRHGGFEAVN